AADDPAAARAAARDEVVGQLLDLGGGVGDRGVEALLRRAGAGRGVGEDLVTARLEEAVADGDADDRAEEDEGRDADEHRRRRDPQPQRGAPAVDDATGPPAGAGLLLRLEPHRCVLPARYPT